MDLAYASHAATGRAVYSDGGSVEASFDRLSPLIDQTRVVRFELRGCLEVVQSWDVPTGWRVVTRMRHLTITAGLGVDPVTGRMRRGRQTPVVLIAFESHDRSQVQAWWFALHREGTQVIRRRDGAYGTDYLTRPPDLLPMENPPEAA